MSILLEEVLVAAYFFFFSKNLQIQWKQKNLLIMIIEIMQKSENDRTSHIQKKMFLRIICLNKRDI